MSKASSILFATATCQFKWTECLPRRYGSCGDCRARYAGRAGIEDGKEVIWVKNCNAR
jgi:hypothetical protein